MSKTLSKLYTAMVRDFLFFLSPFPHSFPAAHIPAGCLSEKFP